MQGNSRNALLGLLRVGSGPPLVLVGGLHGHFEFQRPVAELLGQHFAVFCFSLPGEDMPAGGPDLVEDAALRLLQNVSAAGLDKFSLCGISMGGFVALAMALQAPERIAKLACFVSFAEYNFLHPQLKRLFDWLLEKGMEKTCRRISRSTFLALTIRELWVEAAQPSVLWDYWKRFRRYHSGGDVVWKRLKMMRKTSLLDRVSQLKMPVLLVGAEKDRLVPGRHALETAQRIPQAELTMVPGSGHLFPFLRPEKLVDILAPFLKQGE